MDRLRFDDNELHLFIERWGKEAFSPDALKKDSSVVHLRNLLDGLLTVGVYSGTRRQRAALKTQTSNLIKELVYAAHLKPTSGGLYELEIDESKKLEIQFFKRIIWDYMICNPRLTTQQEGQKRVIRFLFETYKTAIETKNNELVPGRFLYMLDNLPQKPEDKIVARLAADIVSSFTDSQALYMYHRLSGYSPGSITDIIAW